eukprot:2810949-Rhodomonas_salina.1
MRENPPASTAAESARGPSTVLLGLVQRDTTSVEEDRWLGGGKRPHNEGDHLGGESRELQGPGEGAFSWARAKTTTWARPKTTT